MFQGPALSPEAFSMRCMKCTAVGAIALRDTSSYLTIEYMVSTDPLHGPVFQRGGFQDYLRLHIRLAL